MLCRLQALLQTKQQIQCRGQQRQQYPQRMYNQNPKRQRLLHQLSTLLADQLIQDDIPADLRQQAIAIINGMHIPVNDKQNLANAERYSLEKASKSVSVKKVVAKSNLALNTEESPKSRTHKKVYRDTKKVERTTDTSFKQDVSPKYVRLSASNSSLQKYGYESEKIKQALTRVRDIESEKVFLEEKVEELKHLIHEEKSKIDSLRLASRSITYSAVSLEKNTSSTGHNFINRRRVYENVEEEEKALVNQLNSTRKQNEEVQSVIREQQELIGMYRVVIEQLKKEVKGETKHKAALQQQVSTSKNILEKARQKYELLYKKTENLINKLDRDIQGILG